MASNLVLLRH